MPQNTKSGSVWKVILSEARLVWQLIRDERVPWYLKIIPIGAVLYVILPIDLMPLNPIDDTVVVSAAFYIFKALCPEEVVAEYTKGVVDGVAEEAPSTEREAENEQNKL